MISTRGPLIRYVKSRVAHALGMPGTFSPPPRVNNPDMHHGTCLTYVLRWMPGLLTSGFLWSRWWEKLSRHSRRMDNRQFYISGERPIAESLFTYFDKNWLLGLHAEYWHALNWPDAPLQYCQIFDDTQTRKLDGFYVPCAAIVYVSIVKAKHRLTVGYYQRPVAHFTSMD